MSDSTTSPAPPDTSAGDGSAPSVAQLAISFGKWMAGYRKGDELWTYLDQQAVDYVMAGSFIDPNTPADRRKKAP